MPRQTEKGRSNSERGEVAFRAGGRTWELKYDYNAIALVEENSGKAIDSITDIQKQFEKRKMSISFLRALLYGGLQGGGHQVTLEEAGDVMADIKEAGKFQDVIKKAAKAFSLAIQPDEEAEKEVQRQVEEREKQQGPPEAEDAD